MKEIQHLYSRAGFGMTLQEFQSLKDKSVKSQVEQLFKDSENYQNLNVIPKFDPIDREYLKTLPKEERQKIRRAKRKEERKQIKALNKQWIQNLLSGRAALREKMTIFWHNHFACQAKSSWFVQKQNNTLRENALGKFGDLLMAVSKDPAMLLFLNNQQNRKSKPNENFAREVMELFTLGIGNYTEEDIKAAARAFTGWQINKETGDYLFKEKAHDFGEKTFMGKTGAFSGEDILKMILEKKETAYFITKKIYRYLVNEEMNESRVKKLSENFYNADYDISLLLKEIFLSDWFYKTENQGVIIKAPVEFLISFQRNFDIKILNEDSPLFIQKVLGQILFYPPNVAGWAGGRAWIDSSTLLFRLNLPKIFFTKATVPLQAKAESDMDKQGIVNEKVGKFESEINWQPFYDYFSKYEDIASLYEAVSEFLLLIEKKPSLDFVKQFVKEPIDEKQIKMIALVLSSSPEYQMA